MAQCIRLSLYPYQNDISCEIEFQFLLIKNFFLISDDSSTAHQRQKMTVSIELQHNILWNDRSKQTCLWCSNENMSKGKCLRQAACMTGFCEVNLDIILSSYTLLISRLPQILLISMEVSVHISLIAIHIHH